MWRRLVQRPMGQFTSRSFNRVNYQSQQWTRRMMSRPYTAPVTIGFLGWLFGGVDYDAVRKDISEILEDYDWDDSSWGPVLIRLAWHASGTYCAKDGTGGSNGATMRFKPECDDGANAGLDFARSKLEKIKEKYPSISYADLWILASYVAIEEMGGPKIEFKGGRSDANDGTACPAVGRLPDAALGADHVRDVFYRMGFNDQEIVALVGGGHAIGRCHPDRSGFDGPWTRAPTTISNEFFKRLFEETWVEKKWNGPKQFVDKATGKIMMLPTDLVMKSDPKFRQISQKYFDNEDIFMKDFATAFKKLTELGC
eukprot:CAMPEP_0201577670 /NCGR_PEP_ID=MMETSP0190_2-20130828/24150_1 /ASSEMBLY_ACC=CAM_ASM_000263 /TAXON_ID=37353 /ORGANISM="Rosalina sp." /LENGTH=311 /DNA_ID=CAMNT_0048009939 /DNA_START=71 /DNA_END=1006 /DNA_ORIENTATION=-